MKCIFTTLSFFCIAYMAQAQYAETFSLPNKGFLLNLLDDFNGVNWTLTPWDQSAGLRDASDYFSTTPAGALEAIDLDQEVCWQSPVLNTAAALTVSLSMDLEWTGFDTDVMANDCSTDWIRVFYSVNGGVDEMVPNIAGGNACATVSYPFETPGQAYDGSVHLLKTGIAGGSTLKIKACVFTNANAEMVRIDNVAVAEDGVVLGNSGLTLLPDHTPVIFPNPSYGEANIRIRLNAEQPVSVRITDTAGRLVVSQEFSGKQGAQIFPLSVEGLGTGLYQVELITENWRRLGKLFLQR